MRVEAYVLETAEVTRCLWDKAEHPSIRWRSSQRTHQELKPETIRRQLYKYKIPLGTEPSLILPLFGIWEITRKGKPTHNEKQCFFFFLKKKVYAN